MTPNANLLRRLRITAAATDPSFPQTLAAFAGRAGVSVSQLSRVERGLGAGVSEAWLAKVAAGLGVDVRALLDYSTVAR